MKPAWLIDEYASMRFTLVCTTARTEPTITVTTANTQIAGRQSSRQYGRPVFSTRSIAANAATLPADAMNAVTGVGAPWYTSGAQTWNGTAATLKPRPTMSSAMPASTNASLRSTGTVASNAWKMVSRLVDPVPP